MVIFHSYVSLPEGTQHNEARMAELSSWITSGSEALQARARTRNHLLALPDLLDLEGGTRIDENFPWRPWPQKSQPT